MKGALHPAEQHTTCRLYAIGGTALRLLLNGKGVGVDAAGVCRPLDEVHVALLTPLRAPRVLQDPVRRVVVVVVAHHSKSMVNLGGAPSTIEYAAGIPLSTTHARARSPTTRRRRKSVVRKGSRVLCWDFREGGRDGGEGTARSLGRREGCRREDCDDEAEARGLFLWRDRGSGGGGVKAKQGGSGIRNGATRTFQTQDWKHRQQLQAPPVLQRRPSPSHSSVAPSRALWSRRRWCTAQHEGTVVSTRGSPPPSTALHNSDQRIPRAKMPTGLVMHPCRTCV